MRFCHLRWLPRFLRLPCVLGAMILGFAGFATATAQDAAGEPDGVAVPDWPQSLVIVTVWPAALEATPLPGQYQAELQYAMEDLGVRVQFVKLEEATRRSFAGRILLLRILEDAGESRRRLGAVPTSALAWTHAPNGSITPFAVVDLAALRRFLQNRSPGLALDRDPMLLGRALARVAAHEIFHIVTRSKRHSPRGLMQASLTVDELVSDQRPPWLGENRRQAQSAFPQALTREVVAAVKTKERRR